ncbi:unnamed protein product, partial [Mesorhabditis spiculigera]
MYARIVVGIALLQLVAGHPFDLGLFNIFDPFHLGGGGQQPQTPAQPVLQQAQGYSGCQPCQAALPPARFKREAKELTIEHSETVSCNNEEYRDILKNNIKENAYESKLAIFAALPDEDHHAVVCKNSPQDEKLIFAARAEKFCAHSANNITCALFLM